MKLLKWIIAFIFCVPTMHLGMSAWIPSSISNYFKSDQDKATDALITLIENLPTPQGNNSRFNTNQEVLSRIQSLLASGANPNVQVPAEHFRARPNSKVTLLTKLARRNALEVTELLLKAGARPNDPSEIPPLFVAIVHCNEEMIALLIKYGADVNKQIPESGQTPLMTARDCDLGMWKLLLKNGANPNAVDNNKNTILMNTLALNIEPNGDEKYDMISILKLLVAYNTDLDLQNNSGITALMIAASKSDSSSIEILLAHGANPNIQDKKGETALFQAIKRGNPLPVASLIKAGTDLSITNTSGDSALSMAKSTQARIRADRSYDEQRKNRLIKQYNEIIEMLQNPSKIKISRGLDKIK